MLLGRTEKDGGKKSACVFVRVSEKRRKRVS